MHIVAKYKFQVYWGQGQAKFKVKNLPAVVDEI